MAEIQSKRQERKRRTTANPVYSGAVFEPEVQTQAAAAAGAACSNPASNLHQAHENLALAPHTSRSFVSDPAAAAFVFQRKKSAVSYLNSPLHQGTRKRGLYKALRSWLLIELDKLDI